MEKTASAIERLLDIQEAFAFTPAHDSLFLQAMKEAFQHQYNGCLEYRRVCQRERFSPDDLRSYDDLKKIPHLFVGIFKERKLTSVPDHEIILTLTSSGTGGKRSAIYLDRTSLDRVTRMARNVYHAYGLVSPSEEVNYLAFTYDPEGAQDLGTVFTDQLLMELTRIRSRFYALKYLKEKKTFFFDLEGTLEYIEHCSRDLQQSTGLLSPLRILGFPSYTREILTALRNRGKSYAFGDRSFLLLGGGWKTMGEREIPKEIFRREVREVLGIPEEHVRDLFGMVEHGVPYVGCELGNYHLPIYGRAYIREAGTLKFLPDGEIGLFHFLTPYIHSFPSISLLTSDLGSIGHGCPCGRNAPYLIIKGRGGITKYQGCAMTALEFLRR